MIKVMVIFGTRPEAIKMAPLVKELQSRPQIETIVCVTAQHRQMLDQVLSSFQITPQYDLDIMKETQTLSEITARSMNGLDEVIKAENPNIVLVHGDTTTTFVGALAAFYNQVSVGHVEAGLRTYDKYSPYPEEINRQMVGIIAEMHFAVAPQPLPQALTQGIQRHQVDLAKVQALGQLRLAQGLAVIQHAGKAEDFGTRGHIEQGRAVELFGPHAAVEPGQLDRGSVHQRAQQAGQ